MLNLPSVQPELCPQPKSNKVSNRKSAISAKLRLAWLCIFAVAIFIRVLYFVETPLKMRGNDTDGHIQYAYYLSNTNFGSLPNPDFGSEYHQTPLYYCLGAVLIKLESIFHAHGMRNLMALSLLFTILTLVPMKNLSDDLFAGRHLDALLFFSLLAFLPGLVFFGGDINNDSLYLLFSFCFISQLNKWWLQNDNKSLFPINCLATVAIFAKASALTLPLVTLISVAFRHSLSKLEKIKLAAQHIVFLACSTGWYFAMRYAVQKPTGLVGHLDHIPLGFRVRNDFHTLITFNPLKVLSTAYNDTLPWNYRRDYFWEFLYKSAYIGQLVYSNALKPIVVCAEFLGLAVLTLAIVALCRDLFRHKVPNAVMLATLFVVPTSLWFLRLSAPFACSQSFRYIPVAAVPIAYLAIASLAIFRPRMRLCARSLLWLSCLTNLVLVTALSFSHPLR